MNAHIMVELPTALGRVGRPFPSSFLAAAGTIGRCDFRAGCCEQPRWFYSAIRSGSARPAGWGAGAACEPLLGRLSNLSSPQLGFRGRKLG